MIKNYNLNVGSPKQRISVTSYGIDLLPKILLNCIPTILPMITPKNMESLFYNIILECLSLRGRLPVN